MPRATGPNYKNSVIYKLTCNTDENLVHVGGTTNITIRKQQLAHKSKEPEEKLNKKSIYWIIKENGGITNFSMDIIEEYPCSAENELINRTLYWEEILGANKCTKYEYEIQDICIHGRTISMCEECKDYMFNSKFCKHDRRLQYCRICRLFLICDHNLIKKNCKKCTRNLQKCKHSILKHLCKCCNETYNLTGDMRICIHDKQKYECDICKDNSMCIHGEKTDLCNICNTVLCIHNKKINYCKICPDGKNICIHNKVKFSCKDCTSRSITINDTLTVPEIRNDDTVQVALSDILAILTILNRYIK